MTEHTLPFTFPYQSTVLALCNEAIPDCTDPALWQDYLSWQQAISEDDLFCLMIEESNPTFAPLSAVDRQALFDMIRAYLPQPLQTAYIDCPHVIAVSCSAQEEEFISAPFWGAMTFATFLASTSDGMVIDLVQIKAFQATPRLLRSHNSTIPFTEPFLSVEGSESRGGYDMKSRGNIRFGLPEVAMPGISQEHTSLAALVIRTYVQDLWTHVEIARQNDPDVRQTTVPNAIDSTYAPGVYGVMDAKVRHFSIAIEWDIQSSADGDPVIVLCPTGDERTWDEWFASYGDLLAALQENALQQVDSEGYNVAAQEARDLLPSVLSRYSNGEIADGDLYFNCSFLTSPDDGPPEFLWVKVDSLTAGGFVGELRNRSVQDYSLQPGVTVTLSMDEVFDWIIEYPDGTLEGGYSR